MTESLALSGLPVHRENPSDLISTLRELASFKQKLGLRAVASGHLGTGLPMLLQGIGFYRCWELPVIVSYFRPAPGTRILDVGSLKSILPIYWALRGHRIATLDLDPRVRVQYEYARYLGREDLIADGLQVYVQDAVQTSFPSGSFDLITCISAVEHFPGDGDIQFMQEANRLLSDGGRLFVSFGIGREYQEGHWSWMFCRTYDEEAVGRRIVDPSGMEVEALMYFEGDSMRKFSRRWNRLPRVVRNGVLGWVQRPIFEHLYRREQVAVQDAHYIGIVLRKGGRGK